MRILCVQLKSQRICQCSRWKSLSGHLMHMSNEEGKNEEESFDQALQTKATIKENKTSYTHNTRG